MQMRNDGHAYHIEAVLLLYCVVFKLGCIKKNPMKIIFLVQQQAFHVSVETKRSSEKGIEMSA